MRSTQDVLDNHLKCFSEGNLTALLSDYASDAIMFTTAGPLKGVDAIKPIFQALFAEFSQPGASVKMQRLSIEGDYAYLLWSAETAENSYEIATDTFVVRNGRILFQTFAGYTASQ